MKATLFCAAALLACALPLRAAEVREQYFSVGADVDTQGHVIATEVESDVPASIAALLVKSVQQWQFVPATHKGRAVTAHTYVSTKLRAIPSATGGYRIQINYEGNGPRFLTRKSPLYPKRAMASHEAAFVIVEATVEPDGRLSDMVMTSRFEGWPVHEWFKSSVMAAARYWRFEPEKVDGKAIATRVRIPVNFMRSRADFTPEQRDILRRAASEKETNVADSAVSLPSDQTVAVDSPLKPSKVGEILSAP